MHKKIALIGIFVSFAFIINLSFVFAQTVPDTTPPTVSITTPPRSTPVSGSILIQAQAADNVKIYGVNFYVDGQKINYYEDRYAPFNTYFNTIKFQNGAHEVIAVARDTSNNYATSSPFVITASNKKSVVPTLIVAPSYSYNGTTTSQRNANITAKLYGTAAGSANYYFYCNSAYSLSTSTSTEPDGKYLNVNSSAQIHKCSYPSSGTYYPKVIIERDGAVAQRRSTASIRPPVLVIKFSVGDKIKVGGYTSTKVNVRSGPSLSGAIVDAQTYNSLGTVLEGPVYSGGYWWWKIDFDNGTDGWVAGNYLVKVASQTTQTTTPTQTTASATTTQPISGTQITAVIYVANISSFSATINWMTNHPMDGQVEFGTSPCPCPNNTPLMSALSSNHVVNLFNLTPATTYYYRVKSKDPNRNLYYTSENQTFTTTNSPDIIDTDADGDGFSDRIEAFVGTDPKVACGVNAWPADMNDDAWTDVRDAVLIANKITSATVPYSKRHDLNTDGVVTNADIEILNKHLDKSCVLPSTQTTTPVADTVAPIISNIKTSNPNNDPHFMTISWTTNEPATGQVEFGASPCPCADSSPVITDLTTFHMVNLYGIPPDIYYIVKSKDAAGNLAVSQNYTFKSPSPPAVSIFTPQNNEKVSGGVIAIVANVLSADGTPIERVEFSLDRNLSLGVATTTPYLVLWNSGEALPGIRCIYAKAIDKKGGIGEANTCVNVLDTRPPDVAFYAPIPGNTVSGSMAIKIYQMNDFKTLELYKDNDAVPFETITSSTRTFTGTYDFYLNTTSLSDGAHQITAKASDGLQDSVAIVTVNVNNNKLPAGSDIYAPTISSINETVAFSSAIITWVTNEPTDGQIEYSTSTCASCFLSTPLVTGLSTNHSITINSLLPETRYLYRIRSRDSAGNLMISHFRSIHTASKDTDGDGMLDNVDSDDDNDSLAVLDSYGRPFFRDEIEVFLGTDSKKACGANAWPADMNDDGLIEIGDVILTINKVTSATVPYSKRHDLNTDGVVTNADIEILNKHLDKSCAL